MLHVHIVPGASRINRRGLIARSAISAGDVIWRADGAGANRRVTRAELDRMTDGERACFHEHAWQIDADTWCHGSPDADPSLLMNHSCDPNAWFETDAAMTARRDIAAGEEVTYDYASSESEWLGFHCNCGAIHCRGRIRDDDFALPELRERYAGHRLSYLDALLGAGERAALATAAHAAIAQP